MQDLIFSMHAIKFMGNGIKVKFCKMICVYPSLMLKHMSCTILIRSKPPGSQYVRTTYKLFFFQFFLEPSGHRPWSEGKALKILEQWPISICSFSQLCPYLCLKNVKRNVECDIYFDIFSSLPWVKYQKITSKNNLFLLKSVRVLYLYFLFCNNFMHFAIDLPVADDYLARVISGRLFRCIGFQRI